MPEPKAGESQNNFIARCVPIVMDEGNTQDQALGKCYGIWRQSKKKSLIEISKKLIKKLKDRNKNNI
jgi:hypothetical protein